MATVKIGDTVLVHYVGTLDSGEMFDSSEGGEPLQFIVGEGHVIDGFDKGVVGMAVGESKKLHLAAEDAYGLPDEDAFIEIPIENIPKEIPLLVGTEISVGTPEGDVVPATIDEVNEEEGYVVIDTNHPLAGLALNFEVTLVQIM